MLKRLTAVAFVVTAILAGQSRRPGSLVISAVRYWSFSDTTRIAIEGNGEARYRADRIDHPDRIFFDFINARPVIDGHRMYTTEVGDKLLKRIRVAETMPGVTRVVLDLESSADFTVSHLENPSRFIIELKPAAKRPGGSQTHLAENVTVEPARSEYANQQLGQPQRRQAEPMREPPKHAVVSQPPALADPPAIKPEPGKVQIARIVGKPAVKPLPEPPPPRDASLPLATPALHEQSKIQMTQVTAKPAMVSISEPPAALPSEPLAPIVSAPPSQTAATRAVARAARATEGGERSLTRALGLKINRVVIDPGHGGPDNGTVGKRGVMEKELVLDVSKRLGKLIEERMASEVIYTRTDDTFIPLQTRTEMANEKKADLFLSIHANSSPHPKIGGIEVYYLNFTRSADALDVAARENASSEKSVFELRDLIQTITLHDKSEESKEFAGKVQTSLQTFESRYNVAAKNRGVKKAPFVVLIGASMPSVLAEVGFLSNAREEMLLKRPDHRQKLAEALYQGVSRYAQTLSHFQVAQRASTE